MLPWLHQDSLIFPDIESALEEPNGLLAVGGDLSTARLKAAYRAGIFPWFNEEQPILWWSPDPRCVLKPDQVHISRSLRKHLKRHTDLHISFDQAFEQVICHCARMETEEGSWITDDMYESYVQLFYQGTAHSVEVWQDNRLIGGLYGLAMGRCYFGESMFSVRPNASKVAFAALCRQLERWQYALIDCQVENDHLLSLGAGPVPRQDFLSILNANIDLTPAHPKWQFDADILEAVMATRGTQT